MGLGEKTIIGVFWTIAGEIIVKCISPITFLVLTRILTPQDFGVVAIATAVLSFVYIISDLGTSKVLVQIKCDEDDFKKYCDSSFWFNFVIGIILTATIFLLSNTIALYNKQPLATPVIKAMSFMALFSSLSTVQVAILNRQMNYKTLFYIRLITVAVPALLSIPIALLGGGLWAIVAGNIGGTLFNMIALWCYSSWKPRFSFYWEYLQRIFSKSIWSTVQQIAVWVPLAFDTYLLSSLLSSSALGVYTTSRTLFSTVTALVVTPFLTVFYSALSKIDEASNFKRITMLAQKSIFSVSVFISLFVLIYSDILCSVIFTNAWDGISEIVRIIFIIMGFESFYSIVVEALRSKGMFKELAINNVLCTIIAVFFQYYAAIHGLLIYTIIRSLSLYFCYVGVFYFSKKRLYISFIDCLKNSYVSLLIGVSIFLLFFVVKDMQGNVYYTVMTIAFLLSITYFTYKEKTSIKMVLGRLKKREE